MSYAKIRFYCPDVNLPFTDQIPAHGINVFTFGFDIGTGSGIYASVYGGAVNDYSTAKFAMGNRTFAQFKTNLVGCLNSFYVAGLGKKFVATAGTDYIEIMATEYGHTFTAYNNPSNTWYNLPPIFSPLNGTVTPEAIPIEFNITSITALQCDSPIVGDRQTRCNYRIASENFTAPNHIQTVPSNGYELAFSAGLFCNLEYDRQHANNIPIRLVDDLGVISVNSVNLPRVQTWKIKEVIVLANDISIVAENVGIFDIATTLTYSIDGITYQASNAFTDLIIGTHTAYILDSLGGIWQASFEILDLSGKPAAFIDISNVNSIQYSDNDKTGNYKSLFDRQKFANIQKRCFVQKFRDELIPTQIRTSYENIIATDVDGTTFPVAKIVANINIEDWRDCQFADGGSGKTLVYFTSGQVYDPTNGGIIGSYNNSSILGYQLADWQDEGNILSFTWGTFIVSDVIFDSTLKANCLVIDVIFESFIPEICKTKYNAEDWDVWEFSIDMGLMDSSIEHQLIIDFTDTAYATKKWISEPFIISDDADLVKLQVSGDQSIDNMVATGLTHTLFLEAQFFDYEPVTELDTFEDDRENLVTLKRTFSQNIMLKTHTIPRYLANKIGLFMLFETILIDSLPFEPIGEVKIKSHVESNNPFFEVTQIFRPLEDTAISNNQTNVVNRVLGASSVTVLGA